MHSNHPMLDGARAEVRLDRPLVVFIENNCRNGRPVLVTQALDVSANGVQVQVDCAIAVGAVLPLCIELPQATGKRDLHLIGEVRWCSPAPAGGYLAGFQFLAAQGTDLAAWKLAVADMLGDESIRLR